MKQTLQQESPFLSKRLLDFSLAFAFLMAMVGSFPAFAQGAYPLSDPPVLSDFVIFSNGGESATWETEIGGHTLINGNIGSNQDLFLQGNPLPGYPAQLNGSAYAGGDLQFGQDETVGSSSFLREVVVNGDAAIGGDVTIWGNLDANSYTLGTGATVSGDATAPSSNTFALISMPAATVFTAGGADQQIPAPSGTSLTLAPGIYGAMETTRQVQALNLSSGDYYFDSMSVQGGFILNVDLTSGNPINIYVVGNVDFSSQGLQLNVNGTGTNNAFVPISDAPELAALIYMETYGNFAMGGENSWGGTVYASFNPDTGDPDTGDVDSDVTIGQYINWTGAVYAYDQVDVADHGKWNYVPLGPDTPA